MLEFLKTVPPWFLILCVMAGGFAFKRSIDKLDRTLNRFEELFDKVFQKHEELENRLATLEGSHRERTMCVSLTGSKK